MAMVEIVRDKNGIAKDSTKISGSEIERNVVITDICEIEPNTKKETSKISRKNIISLPASTSNGSSDVLIHEESKRCVSEFSHSPPAGQHHFKLGIVNEEVRNDVLYVMKSDDLEESEFQINDSASEEKHSEEDQKSTVDVDTTEVVIEPKSTKQVTPEAKATSNLANESNTVSDSKVKENLTEEIETQVTEDATLEEVPDTAISVAETKPPVVPTSLNESDSSNSTVDNTTALDSALNEQDPIPKTEGEFEHTQKLASKETNSIKDPSLDLSPTKENEIEHNHPKKNLSFKENQDPETAMLRKKDANKENSNTNTKVFRESYFLKTKGKIFYKKKGPFAKWRSQFIILDDTKQQMCFFKSQEEYEKLARCKNTIDLRFITEIKHQKPNIFQSNFPFKVYRRAGLSTVKLAAETQEERARWITTIEEIIERIKATPERDLETNQRSSTLPNIKKKKSVDDVSTDSETCTTSSAPEQDDLIRPKKVAKSGFKIDSNQITSIKLKRTSSQMTETRDSKLPEEEEDDLNPQEKFGVSLRRVQTEKAQSTRDEREKSPDYVEFKQKYNSLSLSRKNKAPNIPLNANSIAKNTLIDNDDQKQRDILLPSQMLKEGKETIVRKRSPSPNIPISKGVEAVFKNTEEESVKEKIAALNSLSFTQIRHATQTVVPQHESVIEDLKISNQIPETQIETTTEKGEQEQLVIDIPAGRTSIPVIQLNPLDHYEAEDAGDVACSVSDEKPFLEKEEMDGTNEEIADITNVHEPLSSAAEDPVLNCLSQTGSETNDDPINDPLKLNAIKKFIQEMKSDASETDSLSCNYPSISIESSTRENSPAIYARRADKDTKSEDSLTNNVRLSSFSYGSQFSTESEEPLPRLNFLGKNDRSSTGSAVLKDTLSFEDQKSEKNSDSEEILNLSEFVRKKSTESFNSLVGIRSSLNAPENTVVEESNEEIASVAVTKMSSNVSDHQDFDCIAVITKESSENFEDIIDSFIELENIRETDDHSVENLKIVYTDKEVANENVINEDLNSESKNTEPNFHNEQQTEFPVPNHAEVETGQQEDDVIEIKTVSSTPGKTGESPNTGEKSYCNKMEVTFTTNPSDIVKPKPKLCKQVSIIIAKDSKEIESSVANQDCKSSPLAEIPKILTEKQIGSSNTSDDLDGEIEILENQETTDYFPSFGGNSVEYRTKEDYLQIEQADLIRTSGIVGLKEFLKNNEDPSAASSEVKSAISRLGHSPAIEKLKDVLPMEEMQ